MKFKMAPKAAARAAKVDPEAIAQMVEKIANEKGLDDFLDWHQRQEELREMEQKANPTSYPQALARITSA